MINPKRVYPFAHDISCPKCGSPAVLKPVYCDGRRRWFFDFWFKRCWVRAVEHLHVQCGMCRAWHARACPDIASEISRETGI